MTILALNQSTWAAMGLELVRIERVGLKLLVVAAWTA